MAKVLIRLTASIVFILCCSPASFSQENPYELPNGLFKPDFITSYADKIQLTPQQRQSIMKEVMALHPKLTQMPEGPQKIELVLSAVTRINAVLTQEQKEKLKGFEISGGPAMPEGAAIFGNAQPVEIQGYHDIGSKEPFISRDGQYLFFNNTNDKPGVDTHIFYAQKIDEKTFKFIGPVEGLDGPLRLPDGINSAVPSLDSQGNFYFTTTSSYTQDFITIHQGIFKNGSVLNIASTQGISDKKHGWFNMDSEISADGKTLFYTNNTGQGPFPSVSVMKAASKNPDGSFTLLPNSDDVLKTVNNNGDFVYAPSSSNDGLELFYSSGLAAGIYVVKRASTSDSFGPAQLAVAGSGTNIEAPSISPDGKHLYLAKKDGPRPYDWHIYVAERK